jgi:CheY-like chemotaxis protein
MNPTQTILLVDDSENDLDLMTIAFKKAEFNNPLQQVRNGEEAIAYLKGEGVYSDRNAHPMPAVMLLDLNMPMKNGFDVLEWVRTQPSLKRMTVIILSASTRIEDIERAFDLGANSFLVKPSALDQLVTMSSRLRDWLEINHFPPLNQSIKRMG